MVSEVVKTIAEQINWRELHLAKFRLIQVDPLTLRIHKGKKNLDVNYNQSWDEYTIKKHVERAVKKTDDSFLNGGPGGYDFVTDTEEIEGVCAERLQPIISDFFGFEYVMDGIINPRR